ncbi:unnamed protein product [Cuscuta campestris]|uniref:Uncharacterized protein n=1 Tax=Cuscuta campestris TaxID=132261 RepID=A0A484L5L8_9ASTE|nr:unnamed protein product [Cuscuta campestris]
MAAEVEVDGDQTVDVWTRNETGHICTGLAPPLILRSILVVIGTFRCVLSVRPERIRREKKRIWTADLDGVLHWMAVAARRVDDGGTQLDGFSTAARTGDSVTLPRCGSRPSGELRWWRRLLKPGGGGNSLGCATPIEPADVAHLLSAHDMDTDDQLCDGSSTAAPERISGCSRVADGGSGLRVDLQSNNRTATTSQRLPLSAATDS